MWTSLLITLERVVIGVPLNVILCILCAYPLSKATRQFKFRTPYVWFLFITILFSGGLLPWFFLINSLNMMDTIWALVLPGAVPVFSVILMLNYFRQVPVELEEAAEIDGANQWQILFKIYVPVALPAIATISLFSFVFHWNSWFDGKLLSTDPANLP
ncbi:MAG: carbohydrate ABC transporter permease, partial [Clostridia bacterium]